ncbi:MAG: UDP-N-acetylglucosamine 2-epimerase (non-hydrolyzing), partial [Bacteroidales bacterium]|nr:UDP-N-acetylglucosamine 2-epimerase (non-hydrolyzing) [Bacteroidales bacterium]
IVVGDVNSTIACSLVATKLNIKVAHVEAGLRSFDRTMPEEINRVLTDVIADYLFVTEKSGLENLKNEGISDSKIFFTGNVMIDSLIYYTPKIEKSKILNSLGLEKFNYVLVTFHRPANVDSHVYLNKLINFLNSIALHRKIVFPVHPRTKNNLIKYDIYKHLNSNIVLTDPIGYIDFQCLTKNSELVITDSGGIQEETTFIGVQCITVRDNTERPCTVEIGTNYLTGTDLKAVEETSKMILSGNIKKGKIPDLWDGKAAERITEIVRNQYLK